MSTEFDKIRRYYKAFNEWERLDSGEGKLEFRRTLNTLKMYLVPNSRVFDLGGGPGRYTIQLIEWGHRVTLADLSQDLLDIARKRLAELHLLDRVDSIDEVNATDLSRYPEGSFDAVLCLGPFYHLIRCHERKCAARQIHRVLKPGGIVFAAYIPRITGIAGLIQRASTSAAPMEPSVFRATVTTGIFQNAAADGFQEGYYPVPGEMAALFENAGFDIRDELSLRSAGYMLEDQIERLDGQMRNEVESVIDQLCRRQEVISTCGHVLLVGVKKG